jgi:hypothetical protein
MLPAAMSGNQRYYGAFYDGTRILSLRQRPYGSTEPSTASATHCKRAILAKNPPQADNLESERTRFVRTMTEDGNSTESPDWQPEGSATVQWHGTVLEALCRQAIDGFHAFAHGGLEIGGVLYGTREGATVRIEGAAELPCEHALGPGFVLSANDEAAFAKLLEAPAGRESIGWYCSHTRSAPELTANDCRVYDRFFTVPGSIALVMKPASRGSVDGVFFFRSADGTLSALPGFTVDSKSTAPAIEHRERPAVSEAGREVGRPRVEEENRVAEHIAEPQPEAPVAEPMAPLVETRPAARHVGKWQVLILTLAAGAIAVGFSGTLRWSSTRLGLRAYTIAPGQVRIEWNTSAPALAGSSVVLEIRDGAAHHQLVLNAEQRRSSSITYLRRSQDVLVRMWVSGRKGAAPLEEEVHSYGVPLPNAMVAVSNPASSAPENPAPALPAALRVVPADRKSPGQLAAVLPDMRKVAADIAPPTTAPPPQQAAAPPSAVRSFHTPVNSTAALDPALEPALPAPPPLATVVVPQLPFSVPTQQPVFNGPRSGRLIWTGSLGRRGVVEIEGGHASVGTLTGALPGVPVAYTVLPAEFEGDGLMVYTSDAARNGRGEPASTANGWNATRYRWEPERVRAIAVLEAPNPSNDFKRLVLRNDSRNCSVILIEWSMPSRTP